MKLGTKTGMATSSLLRLLAALTCVFFAARPAHAQCTDATATRPILFVPGIGEDATTWGTEISGIRGHVIAELSSAAGYSNFTPYNLYFDGSTGYVRLAHAAAGDPLPDPVVSSVMGAAGYVPCDARNFAISFYGWAPLGKPQFDPSVVAGVSILTKANELSQVLKAIAGLTYVQDSVVIAHSMGALDARAYIEGLGSPLASPPILAPCTQLYCPMPSTLTYTGEVGHLITVDGANAGSYLGYINNALFGLLGLNVSELEPTSAVVQALNCQGGTLISSETTGPRSAFRRMLRSTQS
jgi:hypothetical protein